MRSLTTWTTFWHPSRTRSRAQSFPKVWLEYTPITDEVRAYYTVLAVSFDQGEAMNTVLECLRDFQVQNQYLKYKYLRKDSVKYSKDDNNMRWATYSSQVKFSR